MRGAEQLAHIVIVARVLIGISDHETDRASCRFPLKHTTKQFHLVCFVTSSRNTALSWSAAVQFLLNEVYVDVNTRRHAVNNAANSLTVAFAEGG